VEFSFLSSVTTFWLLSIVGIGFCGLHVMLTSMVGPDVGDDFGGVFGLFHRFLLLLAVSRATWGPSSISAGAVGFVRPPAVTQRPTTMAEPTNCSTANMAPGHICAS